MVDALVFNVGIIHNNKFLERMSLISTSMWTGGVVESEGGDTVGLLERKSFYPFESHGH